MTSSSWSVTSARWEWCVAALLAAAVPAFLIAKCVRHESRLRAPTTISELVANDVQIGRVHKIVQDGQLYIRIDCAPSERVPLALGVPAYVFDRTGALKASSLDSGDDERFMMQWNGIAWEAISLEEALALAGTGGRAVSE